MSFEADARKALSDVGVSRIAVELPSRRHPEGRVCVHIDSKSSYLGCREKLFATTTLEEHDQDMTKALENLLFQLMDATCRCCGRSGPLPVKEA